LGVYQQTGMMLQDRQLIEQFVAERSEAAFRQIVERHSRWLFSVCLRRLGDRALAEDATQAVFLALAQRAPRLVKLDTLSPWLHQAAKYCALNMLRARRRRECHESEAAKMKSLHIDSSADSQWGAIEGDLESALDRLRPRERAAVLLRFYEQKTHAEIAALLGISLEASQKRLSRAMDRLRGILVRSAGQEAALSASAIEGLLAKHAVGTAPASLHLSASAPGNHLAPVAKQIQMSMSLATFKAAAIAATVLVLAIPSSVVLLRGWMATPVMGQTSQPVAVVAPAPSTQPAGGSGVYKVPNGLFLVRTNPGDFLIGLDANTKRTPDSWPAGFIKSLRPTYPPNNQQAGLKIFGGPYPDLRGKRIRLSAWVKTKSVSQWCGLQLYMVAQGDKLIVDDDMSDRPVHGTTDWTLLQTVVDVPSDMTRIAMGTFLYGKGEVWSDDMQLEIVDPRTPLTDPGAWHRFSFFDANYTAAPDPSVMHDGNATVCISSTPQARRPQWVSFNREDLNIDQFRGHHIVVTLWLKSRGVTGGTGPWIKVYGQDPNPIGDEGQVGHRPLKGTTDWKQYMAEVNVPRQATGIDWGVVMNGTGKLWLDVDSAQCVINDQGDTSGL